MFRNYSLIAILIITFIASGCIGGGTSGDTGLNIGPGGKTITVTNFEIQPRSILSGSSTQIQLGIVNTGGMNANVSIGENGKQILRNYCPDIFEITSFDAYSTRNSQTSSDYTLKPGDELTMSWSLKNSNTGSVPTYGYKCPASLQIGFDYGVTAYQQLQVKKNSEVQGSTNIQSRTSQGPLNLHLEMIGSTSEKGSPTFIKGDNMEVLVQMENTAPEDSSYQGLVSLKKPVIESSERFLINSSSCNLETEILGSTVNGELTHKIQVEKNMRLYQGQSRVIRCGVVLKQNDESSPLEESEQMNFPSVKGQIESKVDYTYVKDLGETQIKVEYRG